VGVIGEWVSACGASQGQAASGKIPRLAPFLREAMCAEKWCGKEINNIMQAIDFDYIGEVAEWLNAPVLKTGGPLRGS
jgi:hypothetical protein